MLSEDEAESIKRQIIEQIEKTFPKDKKEFARQQILSMNSQELEEFLEKNKILSSQKSEEECIFCSIISGKIKSYKIGESNEAIAVLEINPISKGHTLIIPKEHISSEKISNKIQEFAKEISEKIKEKLKPREVKIFPSELFGHSFINILPLYHDKTEAKRHKASEEELIKIKKEFEKKEIKKEKEKREKKEEKIHLPKRIP